MTMTKSKHEAKYFQLFPVFIFCCVLVGVKCSDLSSCYKINTSWRNFTLVDEITPVLNYEECQAVCQVTVGCEGWTWTTEDNTEHHNYCYLYSNLGLTSQSPDCISGPRSCLCSNVEACEIKEENLIVTYPNTLEEGDCRELCESEPGCGYYTWYDASDHYLASVCLLLSSCSERNSSCTSCHSAPVPCSQAISPTPTPPTPSHTSNYRKSMSEQQLYKRKYSELIISGGSNSNNSVEIYDRSSSQHSLLPDLPGDLRYDHTMEERTVCGGGHTSSTKTSCLTLTNGTWRTTTTLLKQR